MANLQKNFKQMRPGRYQNSSNRIVRVESMENVEKLAEDRVTIVYLEKWTGTLLKANGQPETTQHFDQHGSLWESRTASSVYDLLYYIGPLEAAAA